MGTQHNIVTSILLTIALLCQATTCQSSSTPTQAPKAPKPVSCKRDIMNSYLLHGFLQANATSPMIICPNIKQNCCNHRDQQRIYHHGNQVIPSIVHLHKSKVLKSFVQLKRLHRKTIKEGFTFKGDLKRQSFCGRQLRDLQNFNFNAMMSELEGELQDNANASVSHYQSFACLLCDGEAHKYITVKGQKMGVLFKSLYCHNYLFDREGLLENLHVKLMEYFVTFQKLADCVHYDKAYDMPFFQPEKIQQANQIKECLAVLRSEDFMGKCEPVCKKIRYS